MRRLLYGFRPLVSPERESAVEPTGATVRVPAAHHRADARTVNIPPRVALPSREVPPTSSRRRLLSRALTAPSAVSKEEAGVFWKGDVGSGQLLVNLRLSSSAELTPVPSLYPVVRFIP
eukprot:GHVU01046600.1.p1 GENE.GHVU01046600.1~~GHVU01046600.1.p1  ORF type:complete len:119 (-),score=3.03 GHVU01046600.1:1-357(-)